MMTVSKRQYELLSFGALEARQRTQMSLSPKSLAGFVKAIGHQEFRFSQHNLLVMQVLEAMRYGKITRLNLAMPPRHSKTELTSVQLAAWMLALYPMIRIILASYTRQLSTLNSRRIREIIRKPEFQLVFPHVRLSDEKAAEAEWETTHGGGLRAVGVGSAVTGFGAHLIITDDLLKGAEEARSPAALENVWQWYVSELRTRMQPEEYGIVPMILNVGTRWSEYDLIGRLEMLQMENPDAERFASIRLPALAEENDPLGRCQGAALWPKSYPRETLNKIKALDEKTFETVYQQNPRDKTSIHFDKDKIGIGPRNVEGWELMISWDLAITEDEHSDWCVGALIAGRELQLDEDAAKVIKEAKLFHPWELHVMKVWRQKARWPRQREMMIDVARRYPYVVHVVEKVRMDLAAVQELEDDFRSLKVRLDTVQPKGDKVSRKANLETCVDLCLFSMVYDDWTPEMLKEFQFFPTYEHDDHVDVVEQGLTWFSAPKPRTEFV